MKLALDVWYELWENAGSRGGLGPDRHPDEEDRHYPWPEDYLTWMGDKEGHSEYHPWLGQTQTW